MVAQPFWESHHPFDDSFVGTLRPPPWMKDAACLEYPSHWWFPEKGASTDAAKSVCRHCLVREQCLDRALTRKEEHGIWGGLSVPEREKARKLGVTAAEVLKAEKGRRRNNIAEMLAALGLD